MIGQLKKLITEEKFMGYIEDNLSKDEKIMARIKHSWAGMFSEVLRFLVLLACSILIINLKNIAEKLTGVNLEDLLLTVLCGTFGALVLFVALYVLLFAIFEIKSAQLVVTNKRIFGRRGFISKYTTDVMLSKVDTVNVSNGFFGAIFRYGTIEIVSGATGGLTKVQRATLRYGFISNTDEFRKAVLDTIDRVKKEEQEAQAKSLSEAMRNN